MKKTLALITAIVLGLLVHATPEAAPPEAKAEAWQPQQLSFEVVERQWPRHDLLIKDEDGAEMARIDWCNGSDCVMDEIQIEEKHGEWSITYPTKLGWGTGVAIYGNKRWRVHQNSARVWVEELEDEITRSYCLSYEAIEGVEYEITSELQGTPGHYKWVEVSRST